ncbi:MAG TPA: methyltransferase [Pyrinomonadaceae bacterium]|jgi:SAM-dependent methyltransferase
MLQGKTGCAVEASFDQYATVYDAALAEGISVSGESKDFFALGRVRWLQGQLSALGLRAETVLDFGCGIGTASPHILSILEPESLVGVDVSADSIKRAGAEHADERVRFFHTEDYIPNAQVGLAYCNGVFHHIPPGERAAALDYVYRCLRPGGLFAFWENNSWNPATRYVMSRCPFDQDAIPVAPTEARRLLRASGFELLRTDFMFIFPRCLRWFRGIEPLVSSLPLGTQYQVLCRKPAASNRHK